MFDDVWDSEMCAEIVRTAAEIFEKNKNHTTLTSKSKHDYVTNVDVELQETLIRLIKAKFLGHNVYGEESVPDSIDFEDPTWLLDPLDGTSNFIFGLPFYGTSVAFVANNKVQVGLVADFVHGDVFTAARGKGAFLNGNILDSRAGKSDFIGISSGFIERAASNDPNAIIALRQTGKFRLLGSQALHLCYVAAGRFKACINDEAKLWDDIAGALIIEESGGIYNNRAGFKTDSVGRVDMNRNLYSCGTTAAGKDVTAIICGMDV